MKKSKLKLIYSKDNSGVRINLLVLFVFNDFKINKLIY